MRRSLELAIQLRKDLEDIQEVMNHDGVLAYLSELNEMHETAYHIIEELSAWDSY